MPRQAPYLQRRGDALSFRIAVPCDLRALIGGRELTKTLRTSDKRIAVPIALEFAATAKRLFNDLRAGMGDSDDGKLRELLIEAKGKLRLREQREQMFLEVSLRQNRGLRCPSLEILSEVSE